MSDKVMRDKMMSGDRGKQAGRECPTCRGKGTVTAAKADGSGETTKACHDCRGTGHEDAKQPYQTK